MKKIAIIDGKSIFYRGYYAMPNLSTSDGTPTGGVYGFAALAIEIIRKIKPDYVVVAWDKAKTNIRQRKLIYPGYKANRKPAPPDFYEQIPVLIKLLEAFEWPFYELDDYEADDILATFSVEAVNNGVEADLITSDLDALQAIKPHVKVYEIKKGLSNIEEFNKEYFEKKYGIETDQFLDFKSLQGDSSDNLPGVPGVGPKTATKLLQEWHDIDNIYRNIDKIEPESLAKKLKAGKESAYITKKVATSLFDAPVKIDWDKADINNFNYKRVVDALNKLEFYSLIKKIPNNKSQKIDNESSKLSIENEIKLIDYPNELPASSEYVIYCEEDYLYISIKNDQAFKIKLDKFTQNDWNKLGQGKLITFGLKQLYHQMHQIKIDPLLTDVYDIQQAAFLINPLKKVDELQNLSATKLAEPIDYISIIWQNYQKQQTQFKMLPKVERVAKQLDFPLFYVLYKIEEKGMKIDVKAIKQAGSIISAKIEQLQKDIWQMIGYEFNISSPSQLAEALFVKLQLPTTGIKKGKTGFSTGQKELDKLSGYHPVIEKVRQYRLLAKLKDTYIDALPKLIAADKRIHTTFNQNTTSTGRLSSTNPNLQNIPIRSELGKQIRQAFISEEGYSFVNADYSQFELRLMAALANDEDMIEVFNSDVDIHARTASQIYNIPIDQVSDLQRRSAKVINFGILYGMSPHGLAEATGMSVKDAGEFITKYFELRKPVRLYLDNILEKAKRNGYVETMFGRRRPTPDISSNNFSVRQAAKRAACNMPIQGTEADLVKLAMIRLDKILDSDCYQVLQVHDSILVECPDSKADQIAKTMKDIMENIAPELKVRLRVDVKIGKNWGVL